MELKNLKPDLYIKNIISIPLDFFKSNNITNVFIDLDNTILDYHGNILNGVELWIDELKKMDINIIILSNTFNKEKISKIASFLEVEYIYRAIKPIKIGFKKALKLIKNDKGNICIIGDQIITDGVLARRTNSYFILVHPLGKKERFITKLINRPIEKIILKGIGE